MRLIHKKLFILAFILCLSLKAAFAFDDGFGPARRTETGHFTVYYSAQIDLESLAQGSNISISDRLLAGQPISSPGGFADMLDALFTRVCDILDMQLYSFHGNIKICLDHQQLVKIYSNLFDRDLGEVPSFYVYDLNAVYISATDFRREILGHEIGHAIISHYFVVLPSVKIQEVLATYVEYQLRKSSR